MFAPLLRVVPHIGLASQIMLNGVIFPASGSWRRRYFAILRKNPALVLLCSWTYPIWEDGSFSPTKDHEKVEPSIARSRARIGNSKWRSLVSYFFFFLLDINLAATDTLISVSLSMPLDANLSWFVTENWSVVWKQRGRGGGASNGTSKGRRTGCVSRSFRIVARSLRPPRIRSLPILSGWLDEREARH